MSDSEIKTLLHKNRMEIRRLHIWQFCLNALIAVVWVGGGALV